MRRFSLLKKSGWIVSYVIITIISFITCFTLQMISTGIPIYCVDVGKSTAEAGIFAGFYSLAVIVSGLFAGRLVDTKGKWNMACFGLGLLCLSIIGKAFLPILALFTFYQIIEGIGFSITNVATAAMVLDTLSNSTIVKGIGYYAVIKSLSYSLGSSFAVSISEKWGTDNFFLIALFIILIAVILNLILNSKFYKKAFPIELENNDINEVKISSYPEYKGIDKYIEINALPICLIQFIFTFSLTLTTSYLGSYTKSIGLLGISIYYTINALTMFVTRMFFSKYIEKLGSFKTCIIGLILATISTIGILFSKNIPTFALLAIPNAIGISFVNPTLNVCSTKNVQANRRGVASSTYSLSINIGSGAGGMIWGLLIPVVGYKCAFFGSVILLSLNILLSSKILIDYTNSKE